MKILITIISTTAIVATLIFFLALSEREAQSTFHGGMDKIGEAWD